MAFIVLWKLPVLLLLRARRQFFDGATISRRRFGRIRAATARPSGAQILGKARLRWRSACRRRGPIKDLNIADNLNPSPAPPRIQSLRCPPWGWRANCTDSIGQAELSGPPNGRIRHFSVKEAMNFSTQEYWMGAAGVVCVVAVGLVLSVWWGNRLSLLAKRRAKISSQFGRLTDLG